MPNDTFHSKNPTERFQFASMNSERLTLRLHLALHRFIIPRVLCCECIKMVLGMLISILLGAQDLRSFVCPASLSCLKRDTWEELTLNKAPILGVEVWFYTQPASKPFQSCVILWHNIICFIADVLRFPLLPSPSLWLKLHPSGSLMLAWAKNWLAHNFSVWHTDWVD